MRVGWTHAGYGAVAQRETWNGACRMLIYYLETVGRFGRGVEGVGHAEKTRSQQIR